MTLCQIQSMAKRLGKSILQHIYILPEVVELIWVSSMNQIDQFENYLFLFEFYGISTIVGCFMTNPFHAPILNICDLVNLGFMAYQPL